MTPAIRETIISVATSDPGTTTAQLEALRKVCDGHREKTKYVRAREARRILGGGDRDISPSTLLRWVREGRVHRYGAGTVRLYDPEELYTLIGTEAPAK